MADHKHFSWTDEAHRFDALLDMLRRSGGRRSNPFSGEPVFRTGSRSRARAHDMDPVGKFCKGCGATVKELQDAYVRELMENRIPLAQACPGEPMNAPECVLGHGKMRPDPRFVAHPTLGPFHRWWCTKCRYYVRDAEFLIEVQTTAASDGPGVH